jgi:hypothetical protein
MVIEAMKMERQVSVHRGGTVTDLAPTVGDTLAAGALVCRILDCSAGDPPGRGPSMAPGPAPSP